MSKKLQNVRFLWADGKITNENFKYEDEVYKYVEEMEAEIPIDNFATVPTNPNWSF